MEKGEKFMVVRDAKVINKDKDYYLQFILAEKTLEIPLTIDNQIQVKHVFNDLILALKKEEFNFQLVNEENNLYSQISKEYIKHLNSELTAVRKELEGYKFLSD